MSSIDPPTEFNIRISRTAGGLFTATCEKGPRIFLTANSAEHFGRALGTIVADTVAWYGTLDRDD